VCKRRVLQQAEEPFRETEGLYDEEVVFAEYAREVPQLRSTLEPPMLRGRSIEVFSDEDFLYGFGVVRNDEIWTGSHDKPIR